MRTSVSAKRCPECGTAATLQAVSCRECGHQFRTRFVEPVQRTQAFKVVIVPYAPAHLLARPKTARTFRLAFLISFLLVALGGGLLWLVWNAASPSVSRPAPAAAVSLSPPHPAEHLYKAIGISMSLYELDQTAGSTGRVIHDPDPHILLLSYDYPDRSVLVSLNRPDVTSDDYRVQTVALYQGKTLLQHRTEVN